jgi:quercetin dioxygenase-like cupin family protein
MIPNGLSLLSSVFVLAALFASGASRTPPSSAPQPQADAIVRKPLPDASIAPDKNVHLAKMVSIAFRPGQKTGVHIHPIPVIGYVVQGTIVFQIDGQPAKTLTAGSAFAEPANAKILVFDNASTQEPASFVACYLMGADDRELIKMVN